MSNLQELPLFPLNIVLFPGQPLALHIFEPRYRVMIGQCIRESSPFGVVLLKSGEQVGDTEVTVHEVGTAALVTHVKHFDSGEMDISTVGTTRFRIASTHQNNPYLTGLIEDFPLQDTQNAEIEKAARQLRPLLQDYLKIFATLGHIELKMDTLPDDPTILAFLTAVVLHMPMEDKQQLLNVADLPILLQQERQLLQREAQILKNLIENGPRWRDDPSPFSPN